VTGNPGTSLAPGDLTRAANQVIEPHLGVGVVDAGLVGGIREHGGRVEVDLRYPCLGCPAMEMIESDIRAAISSIEGVSQVAVRAIHDRPWRKSDLAPEAAQRLTGIGITA
jgi:metal-sulfur cluster biosynthetic enzyme